MIKLEFNLENIHWNTPWFCFVRSTLSKLRHICNSHVSIVQPLLQCPREGVLFCPSWGLFYAKSWLTSNHTNSAFIWERKLCEVEATRNTIYIGWMKLLLIRARAVNTFNDKHKRSIWKCCHWCWEHSLIRILIGCPRYDRMIWDIGKSLSYVYGLDGKKSWNGVELKG